MSERNVPEIRFRGFGGEWKKKQLGEIGGTYTGLSGKSKNDFGHGNGKYITYMNVFSNVISDPSGTEKIEVDEKQNKVTAGDVFFTTSSETPEEVGMSSVCIEYGENIYLNSFCFGYRPEKIFENQYLAFMLRSMSIRKKITFLAQGISRYNISKNKVMEITVPIPDMREQTKIGDFFKNLDNLIAQNQKKYDKLVNMKKACLDKMFPKDGADTPEVRFKGFCGKWKSKILGNSIAECIERTSDFKNFPLYSLTIEKGVTEKTVRYERAFLVTKEADLFKIVPPQCFVTNPMNLRFGAVGYNKTPYNISVSGYYDVFCIDESRCSEFWNAYLKTNQLLKKYDDIATGSLIEKRRVHFAELKKIKLLGPCALEEQIKIGTFFQNLDTLITAQKTKLEKLKNIKKACLDKMFI